MSVLGLGGGGGGDIALFTLGDMAALGCRGDKTFTAPGGLLEVAGSLSM